MWCAVEEDAAVVALLEGGFRDVVALSADIVGSLPEALTAARPDIRVQEMPLGNVICDAMLQALAQSVCILPRLLPNITAFPPLRSHPSCEVASRKIQL